jgi:hypothetical protein
MDKISPGPIHKALNLDYNSKNDIWLTRQNTLRKLVGILGMLLPVLLYLFLFTDTHFLKPLESISHYYYTRVGSIFVIIVSLLAIFLLIYKGADIRDFMLSTLAAIAALFVVLFPTSNIIGEGPAVTILRANKFRESFHLVSAALFLLSLSSMALFLFTLSDKPASLRTHGKKIRNRIFRTCGIIMILALLIIVAGISEIIYPAYYNEHHLTFWMETLAIESFGFSWLIKGGLLFKDTRSKS